MHRKRRGGRALPQPPRADARNTWKEQREKDHYKQKFFAFLPQENHRQRDGDQRGKNRQEIGGQESVRVLLKIPLKQTREQVVRGRRSHQRKKNRRHCGNAFFPGGVVKAFGAEDARGKNHDDAQQKARDVVPDLRIAREEKEQRQNPQPEHRAHPPLPHQTESRQTERKVCVKR